MKLARSLLFPLIVVAALVWLAIQTLTSEPKRHVAYSELIARVETNPHQFQRIVFVTNRNEIDAKLVSGKTLVTSYPTQASQLDLQRRLERAQITFDTRRGRGRSGGWTILTWILPFVLLAGFWIFLTRKAGRRPS